tara:strand:+ start:416 stop:634 length:219 start_codon:yes stop_codon:yes gene_type:complete
MNTAGKYKIEHIIDSLINGQFKQAKEQTQYRCKTKPEKQAYRVAQVVGALMDKENCDDPDMAVKYLKLFDRD